MFCIPDGKYRRHRIIIVHGRILSFRIAKHAADDVRVGIDKSGHQRRVAEIDNTRPRRDRYAAACPDRGDLVVSNDDDAVPDRYATRAVDQLRGSQDDRSRPSSLARSSCARLLPRVGFRVQRSNRRKL